jgi:hypothetical protein
MSQTTKELKSEVEKTVALLQTLRDEVRVKVRLAGMDAKDRWKALEPELAKVERATQEVSEAARDAATKGVKALKEFLASL